MHRDGKRKPRSAGWTLSRRGSQPRPLCSCGRTRLIAGCAAALVLGLRPTGDVATFATWVNLTGLSVCTIKRGKWCRLHADDSKGAIYVAVAKLNGSLDESWPHLREKIVFLPSCVGVLGSNGGVRGQTKEYNFLALARRG